ncbi:MAG TPA: hypothetical protein VEW66_03630, partial [Thermomicrobiales bacterium]|nr:hypothetical protein [Thermomicrobiales bacterium]
MSSPTSSPPPTGDGSKSRLDREIDEILARNDNIRHLPPPPNPARPRAIRPKAPAIPASAMRLLSTPIFLALILAIVAFLLRDVSALLANILITLAVASIIWPIVQGFRRPAQAPTSQMWRGQVFEV